MENSDIPSGLPPGRAHPGPGGGGGKRGHGAEDHREQEPAEAAAVLCLGERRFDEGERSPPDDVAAVIAGTVHVVSSSGAAPSARARANEYGTGLKRASAGTRVPLSSRTIDTGLSQGLRRNTRPGEDPSRPEQDRDEVRRGGRRV